MQISDAKYEAMTVGQNGQSRRTTSPRLVMGWAIASVLIAAPLPVFAATGLGESTATTHGGSVADRQLSPPDLEERFSLSYRMKVK